MLGFLFGFNARLGRLHYFLASIAFVVVATIVVVVALVAAYSVAASPAVMTCLIVLFLALALWSSTMLMAMRIRDIGWDPVCVIPLWIAGMIVDAVVAMKVPEWSLTASHAGTPVGALMNLGLNLALIFWPSGDRTDDDDGRRTDYAPRPAGRVSATPSEARLARVSSGDFGRRGV